MACCKVACCNVACCNVVRCNVVGSGEASVVRAGSDEDACGTPGRRLRGCPTPPAGRLLRKLPCKGLPCEGFPFAADAGRADVADLFPFEGAAVPDRDADLFPFKDAGDAKENVSHRALASANGMLSRIPPARAASFTA